MTRFRIGFTITGETLMKLAAKAFQTELEFEQLSIEELPTVPNRITTMVLPRRKGPPKTGPRLDSGMNRIIFDVLSDGEPHHVVEMKKPFKAHGYAESSVGSRLDRLKNYGLVERDGNGGGWRMTNRWKDVEA